ncbi:hypothetical protein ES705_12041 [subsurface metagenome]
MIIFSKGTLLFMQELKNELNFFISTAIGALIKSIVDIPGASLCLKDSNL